MLTRMLLGMSVLAVGLPVQAQAPPPDERSPAYVGEVRIIGNRFTRDDVIRRQIPLPPGQILSYPDIRRAESNLRRLGIFQYNPQLGVGPTVEVLDPYGPSPVKDILVTVSEAPTRSVWLGVGVDSDAGVNGGIIINEKNFDITRIPTSWDDLLGGGAFRGGGQEFNLRAIPGNEVQDYSVSWREPFLLDSAVSLVLEGYYKTRDYLEYDESRLGTHVGLGRHFGDYWTVSGGLRVENVGVDNVAPFAPADYLNVLGDHFLTRFRAGVVYDDRDSYSLNSQGQRVALAFEQVVGDIDYPIVTLDAMRNFTFFREADGSGGHVLALHSQLGVAGSATPVFDRFFAGGLHSIRGFSFRGVGPQVDGFKVGGDFLLVNSVEYRLPILANDSLYVVGFVDSGTVESDVAIRTYRVAAGVGLRIIVPPPLGPAPISIDFGFPVVEAEGDVEQVFSFTVGITRGPGPGR